MRNYIGKGDVLTLTAVEDLTSGEGTIIGGNMFVVATGDALTGAKFEGLRVGQVELPKAAGVAVEEGKIAYFNNATNVVTDISAAGLYAIGCFTADVVAGGATAPVALSGAPVKAEP